ncbi:MAG: MmcQ/YjbR family DNA-binding protein [Prevotella sp.]|nr:MmcQ/YjbR family DNA-binding protein [Prevotella sp.]
MDYSNVLHSYQPIAEKLREYGFTAQDGGWLLQRNLPIKNLVATIHITASHFDVRVIDRTFNDDFLPFQAKEGGSAVKAAVNDLLDDILAKCCRNAQRDIIAYCEQTYHTPHANPWAEFPTYCTFKTVKKQKWYAVVMDIPCQKLGLTGKEKVFIINLKLPTAQIQTIIDHQHYFPAYHMNKQNWLSVLLDKDTDMAQLKTLLDASYHLVENNYLQSNN